MTMLTTPLHEGAATSMSALIGAATAWADGQTLLSQRRCVDVLLDLHGAARDEFLRRWILDRLYDIRFLQVVDGDDMRSDLSVIASLALSADTVGTQRA